MKQRSLVAVGAGIAVGIGLAVVFGLLSPRSRDTDTDVTLSPVGGKCEAGKANLVRVRHSKNLKWEIANYCTDSQQVMVGNFRTDKDRGTGITNCTAAGPQYPFADDSATLRTADLGAATQGGDGVEPTEKDINLKVKGRDELPQGTIYYFDLCVNGAIVDPMLIIER